MNNLRFFFGLPAVLILSFSVWAQTTEKVQIAENLPSSEKSVNQSSPSENNQAAAAEKAETAKPVSILSRVGVQNAQVRSLSLNEAIRMALENNNAIEISRTDVRYQESQLRSILGIYDPVFTISPTYTRSSTTGSNATNDFRANAGLTKFFRSGGSVQSFFNNTRSENAFTQSQLSSGSTVSGTSNSAIYSSNLGFNFTQPLFRNYKIDNNRRQIRIQRKRLQQSDADFRRQTIDVISQVQRAYWDLVFALRDQQNRIANLDLAKENLRQIVARIDAGVSAPLARAEVETELANREFDVLAASQQVSINENTLKAQFLKDSTSPQWSDSLVPTDAPVFSSEAINLDEAIKDAMDNRPELKRLEFAREINKINIEYFKNQTKPQIDFTSQFSLNGLARGAANTDVTTNLFNSAGNLALLNGLNEVRQLPTVNLPAIQNPSITIPAASSSLYGGFNRSLLNLFRTDAPNFSVGVTISFPFNNQTAKANLAGERILQEQSQAQTRQQEETILVDVRNAVQAVETARQQVLAARRARENAEIQLNGERKLFDAGRSTTFLLFQRENSLTNARNTEIRAETNFNKSLSDLQRATSTTFRANGIQIESPMDEK